MTRQSGDRRVSRLERTPIQVFDRAGSSASFLREPWSLTSLQALDSDAMHFLDREFAGRAGQGLTKANSCAEFSAWCDLGQ